MRLLRYVAVVTVMVHADEVCTSGDPIHIEGEMWCVHNLSAETLSAACTDARCLRDIFCYVNPSRPLLRYRHLWSESVFKVTSDAKVDVVGASTDTRFTDPFTSEDVIRRTANKEVSWLNKFIFSYAALKVFSGPFNVCTGSNDCSMRYSYYGSSCVRVVTEDDSIEVDVMLQLVEFRWQYYLSFICIGLLIVKLAPLISDQILFYYMSGVVLGVFLFILFVSNFLLKRSPASSSAGIRTAVLIQATFLGISSYFWNSVKGFVAEYQSMIASGLALASLFSFGITHWWLKGANGPEVSSGFKDLVNWGLQLIGYFVLAFGSMSVRWSLVLSIGPLFYRLLYPIITAIAWRIGISIFPNWGIAPIPVRYLAREFLSMEEYAVEGEMVTDSAMKNLLASSAYQEWFLKNVHRVSITPPQDTEELLT